MEDDNQYTECPASSVECADNTVSVENEEGDSVRGEKIEWCTV